MKLSKKTAELIAEIDDFSLEKEPF